MLSQVGRRLIRHGVLGMNVVENAAVFPSLAHYSSKDDDKKKTNTSGGVSEPVKRQERSPSVSNSLFDEMMSTTSTRRNVNFKKRNTAEKPATPMKNLRPGQLNSRMVQAVKDVAAKAGPARDEVVDDLLGKLDEVFLGIDRHHGKSKRKPFDKKQAARAPSIETIPEISDDLFGNNKQAVRPPVPELSNDLFESPKPPPGAVAGEEDVMEMVREAVGGGTGRNFISARPFSTVEELLASETPLEIFSSNMSEASDSPLKFWQSFEQKELRRITRFEPLNWFDQCIVWTEEGKLWKFPIDNEQGMDEEAKVDFTEHIFLDGHIESWCPKQGPIKHFMELVTVGLSKNAFLTVAEKKETLEWYRQYFMQHRSLLEEIDAFGSPQNPILVDGKVD